MARKKASKTGTYKIGGEFFRFMEGDELPEGANAALVEEEAVATGSFDEETQLRAEAEALDAAEERAKGPAPENRAKAEKPENR